MGKFLKRFTKRQTPYRPVPIDQIDRLPSKAPALPPGLRMPAGDPAGAESLTARSYCTKHDKPFEVRFARQTSGKVRFVESVKLSVDGCDGSPSAGASAVQTIPMEDFEGPHASCPWCGDPCAFAGPCPGCRTFVCGARWSGVIGDPFHCRDSCGATWPTAPRLKFEVNKEETQGGAQGDRLPPKAAASPPAANGRALIVVK
jgi:hypothetical protein